MVAVAKRSRVRDEHLAKIDARHRSKTAEYSEKSGCALLLGAYFVLIHGLTAFLRYLRNVSQRRA